MQRKDFNHNNCADPEKIVRSMETDKIICMVCDKRHFPDEETFFTFYGNVTVGLSGGIIGNNIMHDGTIGRLMFLCLNGSCLNSVLGKYTKDVTISIKIPEVKKI